MKSWTPPTDDMVEKVLSSVKKETDRQYFFSKLDNPLWVKPLRTRGYFASPPALRHLPDGYVQFPHWPELAFLVKVAEEATEQVLEIVLALPKTDNPRVYDEILSIACKLVGQESAKLLGKLIESTKLENQSFAHRYPELLKHWSNQGNIKEAIEVVRRLIPFKTDPRALEKQQIYRQDPNAFGTSLEPSPSFKQWEYQQILELGVRPLADNAPYQTALILVDATAGMIRMGKHSDDLKKDRNEDYSEIWCPRLDNPHRDYQEEKGDLVHTLTYACARVFSQAQESIPALDQVLRKQPWKVFKRLRQQLYASHPTEPTLPWIRELILEHGDYSKWEHHFEFQLMIRKACEQFGSRLLSDDEKSTIVDQIRSGPSKDDFREWMGERYTDAAFQQRQRQFHLMQLRPFGELLSGESRQYFVELENALQSEVVTDDSYSPYEVGGGAVSYQSPKSAEELDRFTDEELLNYLNGWNEEHRDRDNWLTEINISALANVFQALFKEQIVPDEVRFTYWMTHRGRIGRPIYVAAMVKTMREFVQDKKFDNLNEWMKFSAWVLSHPDSTREDGQPEPQDESLENPDWGSSRRAVVDFIDACVNKDTDTPFCARGGLADLLQKVCSQPDWRLDHSSPVLLNRDDPITEAINNTRSRALESLINFGFWIWRHLPEDSLPDVTDILSERMAGDAKFALTRPEQAILGMQFGNLCVLNREWAIGHRSTLFPQSNAVAWRDAFGSYLRFSRAAKSTFEILREDFEFALDNPNLLTTSADDDKEVLERLGQHLFTYYLWAAYPLKGDQSLLARFYDKTSNDRKRWAKLFHHVGHSLKNSGKHLDKELSDRAIAFCNWRIEAAEPQELQKFTFWLAAECLEPEWRLRSYSKILDLTRGKNVDLYSEVQSLNELLPKHLPLIVECFLKITSAMNQGTQLYISTDDAKPILRAGLSADDPQVRQNAERARELLLRLGRFDYLELG